MKKEDGKLVRDKIPDIIRAEGQTPLVRTLEGDDLVESLKEKLNEECAEFQAAADTPARLEELADVLEVVYALAAHLDAGRDGLEKIRAAKHVARGGFDKGYFLMRNKK